MLDAGLHSLGEPVTGTLEPRQVDEDQLGVALLGDAPDGAPGGLRPIGGDGDLLTHDLVYQGRLADVGAPGEGDEACPRHQEQISACRASISP